jgi:hypothetical protein
VINDSDSGGTHIDKRDGRQDAGERIEVPCKPLTAVLAEAGIVSIDALKIDVEGAEDIVLAPFLRDAPQSLLPHLILIEDTRGVWGVDLFALLARAATLRRSAAARMWRCDWADRVHMADDHHREISCRLSYARLMRDRGLARGRSRRRAAMVDLGSQILTVRG